MADNEENAAADHLAGEEEQQELEEFEPEDEEFFTGSEESEPEGAAGGSGSGCKHYDCKCSIVAPCCNKQYFCRLCHNEAEEHEVDRFTIEKIICRNCELRQPPADKCSKCETVFGSYVCLKCRLFDFNDKKQWHCEGCGICRVGGKENFFHCDRCGYCLALSMQNQHKCIPEASKDRCAVCWGNMHESRDPLMISKCGHPLHRKCRQQMIKHNSFSCPVCKQSMFETDWRNHDELAAQMISEMNLSESELRDAEIFCNDCHKKSTVKDYLIGMLKCPSCGSYNTQK